MQQIAIETLTSGLLEKLRPLIAENHAETGSDQRLAPLDDAFLGLQSAGLLRMCVARVDGDIAGYCAVALAPCHISGELAASSVAIYVSPAQRALAAPLVRFAEADARAGGACSLCFHVPHLSRAGAFFERIGYDCTELVLTKRFA